MHAYSGSAVNLALHCFGSLIEVFVCGHKHITSFLCIAVIVRVSDVATCAGLHVQPSVVCSILGGFGFASSYISVKLL